jgi:nicotinamide-nucleotide adenylyltransferase
MTHKPYDLGLVVGRFQHIHVGHEHMINTALKLCDRVLILVGSAQETGDSPRNPFNIATRIEMIQEIYETNVIVKALPDMTHEDDINPEWGRYVLRNVEQAVYKTPEAMIYGNDEARSNWFDPEDIKAITEVIVSRSNIKMSATTMRDFLVRGMRHRWMEYANPRLHKHFDRLRAELMSTPAYKHIGDSMLPDGGM